MRISRKLVAVVIAGLTGLLLVQLLYGPRSIASEGAQSGDSMRAARRALYRAIENEKSNPSDESSAAVKEALKTYEAIVAERESEILSRLKAIQPQDGSIPPYADDVHPKIADPLFLSKESSEEYRSLNAELAALQTQLAEVVAAVKRPRSEDRERTKLTALRPADLFVVTQSEGATGTCTGTPINATLGQGSPSLPSVSGQQTGRIFRNGITFASQCNSPGSCSLFTSTGSRLFDAYALTNNIGASACVTITFSKPSTCNNSTEGIFSAAYLNGYNPSAPCLNRVGDPGISLNFGSATYSFGVPNGSSFTVVFHEVDPGTQAGCPYSFTIQASPSCSCALNCPQSITRNSDLSKCGTGANVNFPISTIGICSSNPPACSPPSDSFFPVGTTAVNCTSSFGASCTFNVTITPLCLEDETNHSNFVVVNPITGDYSFFCNATLVASGRGTLNVRGCMGSIESNKADRRVFIEWDTIAQGKGAGTAIVQLGPNNTKCQITDKDMTNNSCGAAQAVITSGGKAGTGKSQN